MTADHRPTEAFERARSLRADLRRALGVLEAALARPAGKRVGAWTAEVVEALRGLRYAFDVHVEETEGPDGLLAEIVELSPRLARSVEKLRDEHDELDEMLVARMAAFADPPAEYDPEWVEAEREQLTDLLVRLVRHRQRGADLSFEAYDFDIGGES